MSTIDRMTIIFSAIFTVFLQPPRSYKHLSVDAHGVVSFSASRRRCKPEMTVPFDSFTSVLHVSRWNFTYVSGLPKVIWFFDFDGYFYEGYLKFHMFLLNSICKQFDPQKAHLWTTSTVLFGQLNVTRSEAVRCFTPAKYWEMLHRSNASE